MEDTRDTLDQSLLDFGSIQSEAMVMLRSTEGSDWQGENSTQDTPGYENPTESEMSDGGESDVGARGPRPCQRGYSLPENGSEKENSERERGKVREGGLPQRVGDVTDSDCQSNDTRMVEEGRKKASSGFSIAGDLDDIKIKAAVVDVINRQFDAEITYKQKELESIGGQLQKATDLLQRLRESIARGQPIGQFKRDVIGQSTTPVNQSFVDGQTSIANIKAEPQTISESSDLQPVNTTQSGPMVIEDHSTVTSNDIKIEPSPAINSELRLVGNKLATVYRGRRLLGRRGDGRYVLLHCPLCYYDGFRTTQDLETHCQSLHGLSFTSENDLLLQCGRPVPEHLVPIEDQATLEVTNEKKTKDNEVEEKGGSRFYVTKTIIVGNTSKYIPEHRRDLSDRSTHKWMVYVRGPREEPHIFTFVKKVWFFMHPSYKPHDVVEINSPPFHLTRHGWGEFPVRVQLHFHNPRNKAVDIIHNLKLDRTYTGQQMLGAETTAQVQIDRRQELIPSEADLVAMQTDLPSVSSSPCPAGNSSSKPPMEEAKIQSDTVMSLTNETPVDTPDQPQLDSKSPIPDAIGGKAPTSHPTVANDLVTTIKLEPHDVIVPKPPEHETGGQHISSEVQPISAKNVVVKDDMESPIATNNTSSAPATGQGIGKRPRQTREGMKEQGKEEKVIGSQEKGAVSTNEFVGKEMTVPSIPMGQGRGKQPRARNTEQGLKNGIADPDDSHAMDAVVANKPVDKDTVLMSILPKCPIIDPFYADDPTMNFPQARTLTEFLRWAPNKRTSTEWLRARHVKEKAMAKGLHMKTSDIMDWCRANGFTPLNASLTAPNPPIKGLYCKYCGLAHITTTGLTADNDMAACGQRLQLANKKGVPIVGSLTSANDLVSDLNALAFAMDEDDTFELDISAPEDISATRGNPYRPDGTLPPEVAFMRKTVGEMGISLSKEGRKGNYMVDNMMYTAMAEFLKDLLAGSLLAFEANAQDGNASQEKNVKSPGNHGRADKKEGGVKDRGLLLPMHVYQALVTKEKFDFLTNAYMGTNNN